VIIITDDRLNNPSNENMRRVPKAWGEEHWIVNKEYCGKNLLLKKGHRCSFHGHKLKDETFYVIKGKVHLELGDKEGNVHTSKVLTKGDIQHLTPYLYHRFTGLEDSEIIEFSTTHREDDSYRVEGMLSGKMDDEEFNKLSEANK